MLRTFLLVAAMLAFSAAPALMLAGEPALPMLVGSGIVLVGILFERTRYGAASVRPTGDDWVETPERFIDDASGRPMAVWFDPVSGRRRYVELDRHPAEGD